MNVCIIHVHVGILAGVHPCGTIAMVGELFGAESKQQVYGHTSPSCSHCSTTVNITYGIACAITTTM